MQLPSSGRRALARANRGRLCNVARCSHNRRDCANYCLAHSRANSRYGDPLGSRLYAKEYKAEFLTAKRFLARHRDHPGIGHALSFVADWIADAVAAQSPSEVQRHLVRLHHHGVTPIDVLRELVAVHLFAAAHPQRFPTDRALTFAYGIAVAYLAPMPSQDSYQHTRKEATRRHYTAASAVAREQLGKEVRHSLSPLFARIVVALADEARHKHAREAAIAAPFIITTHNGVTTA